MDYLDYNAPVILSFFFISLIVLIINKITNDRANKILFSNYRSSIFSPLTYIRMFTHIFGHQNWSHFMNNFLLILLVGPMMEEKYGSINILIMILITAGLTGLLNMILSRNRITGASVIVFMLIVISSFVNISNGKIPLTLILVFIFYIINEILSGIFKKDNVSHFAHIV